jgi:transposase
MKPYSYDLRIRIFAHSLCHSIRKTAQLFHVSPNTVYLLTKLFVETGDLVPRENKYKYTHLITQEGEIYLELLLAEEVDLTLEELCNRYEEAYSVRVSIGTMYNTLKKLNITRKKKTFSDPKKDTDEVKIKKENYDIQLEKIEPEKRYYLDETGSCTNMSPSYGRSKKGLPVYDNKPTYPGDTVSTVAILTEEGIKATYTYSETLIAPLFISYLNTFVLPILNDEQILIMDNLPVHHAKIVQEYLMKIILRFFFYHLIIQNLTQLKKPFLK